ncbi:MAG TPA: stalk domain-containing protein [Anaerovoracaceae bacterium]|nr:stalk domain-containing protein [Anaerovoracaceae bacterium]
MKRVIVLFLLLSLFLCNSSAYIYAAETKAPLLEQKKIVVYLKPDVSVELSSVKQIFRDSKGTVVYPIIYNGSTYLPVRAVSGLMEEPIEWDGASKTVFIGRTLSNPNKILVEVSSDSALLMGESYIPQQPKLVNAYLKPDVLVMYDFALQTFKDANGNRVFPIIYNGTTYLPVRAISELMKEPVAWDGVTKTVYIGDGNGTPQESQIEEEKEKETNIAAKNLKSFFEREEVLYYEATAKTTSIKASVSLEEKQIIASTISENYLNAQNLTAEIKAIDTLSFTEEEKAAYDKIAVFAESTEYYILVLENIAYLAAQDADYSMLAETFFYFAMDSQTKMEDARLLVMGLN